MKCPRCHADITGKRKCDKCGLDFTESVKEIEVQYKDFKTSELLEIRQKKQAAHGFEESKAGRGHKEEKALKSESPEKALCEKDKKPSVILAAIVVVLAITGVFLIFRYFLMR